MGSIQVLHGNYSGDTATRKYHLKKSMSKHKEPRSSGVVDSSPINAPHDLHFNSQATYFSNGLPHLGHSIYFLFLFDLITLSRVLVE